MAKHSVKNQADYFRNKWWDMVIDDRPREVELAKDSREVFREIIRQEVNEGKGVGEVAREYRLHITSVYRMAKG